MYWSNMSYNDPKLAILIQSNIYWSKVSLIDTKLTKLKKIWAKMIKSEQDQFLP